MSLKSSAMASENRSEAEIPKSRPRPSSLQAMAVLLAAAAIALGFFIYSGIRSRLEAASTLQRMTEDAAVSDVVVVHPKKDPPTEEITLPGGTQPYISSPIYARTNGYLVSWFFDIGARVK